MTEEQKTLLIERYLKGELPDAERQEVERMIENDAQFAEDVSAIRLMLTTLEDRDLVQFHRQITAAWDAAAANETQEQKNPGNGTPMRSIYIRRWLAAAGVALLFLAWYLLQKDGFSSSKGEVALRQYDTAYQTADFTTMGAGDQERNRNLTQFQDLFNKKKFKDALPYIKPYATPKSEYELYEGICRLRMDPPDLDKARQIFMRIDAGDSPYQTEGTWFLALTYARAENWDSCAAVAGRIPQAWPRYPAAQALKNEALSQKETSRR